MIEAFLFLAFGAFFQFRNNLPVKLFVDSIFPAIEKVTAHNKEKRNYQHGNNQGILHLLVDIGIDIVFNQTAVD